jgi:hypothetical protein
MEAANKKAKDKFAKVMADSVKDINENLKKEMKIAEKEA